MDTSTHTYNRRRGGRGLLPSGISVQTCLVRASSSIPITCPANHKHHTKLRLRLMHQIGFLFFHYVLLSMSHFLMWTQRQYFGFLSEEFLLCISVKNPWHCSILKDRSCYSFINFNICSGRYNFDDISWITVCSLLLELVMGAKVLFDLIKLYYNHPIT